MLTLKFMGGRDSHMTVIEVTRIDVQYAFNGSSGEHSNARITVYPQITSEKDAVEFLIDSPENHPLAYSHCYVQNSFGKTIDKVGPFN